MEDLNNTKVWNSYFGNIRKKYDLKVSEKKPLVIFLDGKGVTTGNDFNLANNYKGGFIDIMEQTVAHFTAEYSCIALFGVDEVSFIFENAGSMIDKVNNNRNFKTNEITSVFSQYFFEYFNKLNSQNAVYWHARCHSIPEQKIESYIKFRSNAIFNTFTTYFLKKNMVKDAGHIKLDEKIKLCREKDSYKEIEEYAKGILYLNGERIELEEYLKGNIKVAEETKKENSAEYIDLSSFDELF